jgi:hypothetical protein
MSNLIAKEYLGFAEVGKTKTNIDYALFRAIQKEQMKKLKSQKTLMLDE